MKSRIKNASDKIGYEQYFGFDVDQLIETLWKKMRLFKYVPIGPLAYYIEAIDKKYAAALESCFAPILKSFIVASNEDKKTLMRLLREMEINIPERFIIVEYENNEDNITKGVGGSQNILEASEFDKKDLNQNHTYLSDIWKLNEDSFNSFDSIMKIEIYRNYMKYNKENLEFYQQKIINILKFNQIVSQNRILIVDTFEEMEKIIEQHPPGIKKCYSLDGSSCDIETGKIFKDKYRSTIWVDHTKQRISLINFLKMLEVQIESWNIQLIRFNESLDKLNLSLSKLETLHDTKLNIVSNLNDEVAIENQRRIDERRRLFENSNSDTDSLQFSIQMRGSSSTSRVFGVQFPVSMIELGSRQASSSRENRFTLQQLLQIVLLTGLFHEPMQHGVSQEVIDRSTKKIKIDSEENIPEQNDCPICLNNFSVGEELREMPCHHFFHSECVDQWLLERSTQCPMCRHSIEEENS